MTLITVLPVFVMEKGYFKRINIVGAAEGCDLLTLASSMPTKHQDQKIAAFGSSYQCSAQKRHCSAINSEAADCSALSP
ncbi:hypothetical protein [Pseudomonas sp. dw_612]|uniref:hypothetical protein n=1 Tax=Pseudomonas sp. dw_612 TaxID=2720080 RepID=UPI001BD35A6D|nr:hypothetical protein [Pseudomonas sp. dw_612]